MPTATALQFPTATHRLGWRGDGFAFDNELAPHEVTVAGFEIDSDVVSWRRYLPFVDASGIAPPRYLRRRPGQGKGQGHSHDPEHWQRLVRGQWEALPPDAPAMHLRHDEAEAWCRWAGRRLPSEAEWEVAALARGTTSDAAFRWGQVWEWTASRFTPYPGFTPHPYRDYSAPWFRDRFVMRGASFATSPRIAHPRYRNFFTPERDDIFGGFRSCA